MNGKPKYGGLIYASLILACIPVIGMFIVILTPSLQFYLFYLLPFGILAAFLARIALNRMKRSPGTDLDRTLAILAYFLGLSPALYFCGSLTYELITFR